MATTILNVDIKQALAALNIFNRKIDETAKKTEGGFDRSAAAAGRARDEFGRFVATGTKGSKSLGGAIGGISGSLGVAGVSVAALAAAFVGLAAVATKAFVNITKHAIQLNEEAELTRLSLIQIFKGNEGAADAFIERIGDLSIQLGISRQELTGLAKGILPDVGSIRGTEDFLRNIIVLGKDAGQGIDSIRLAAEEALSGNLSSLQRRLNIPVSTIESIKKYQKEMSAADAITKGLAERVAATGVSAEITANSFSTLRGAIQGQLETLQRELGVAPFEELKEQAEAFLDLFDEKRPEITRVAQAFGDLAANVIEFVGTNITTFIENIDFEEIEELVDAFSDTFDVAKLLLDVLLDMEDLNFNALTSSLTELIENTKDELEAIAEFATRARAEIAFTAANAKVLGIGGRLFASAEKEAEAAAAGMAAFNAVMDQGRQSSLEFAKSQEESEERTKDRRKEVEDTTEADIAAGEAALAHEAAVKDLADAQAKAAEAQEEIDKKRADLAEDLEKRLTDIQRKEAQRRFDDQIKAAQRREDIARKNVDAIEKIFRENEQDIVDAAKDLTREEQAIARNGARERRQIERDAANERVDIERNFRRELKRIQDQFNQDAIEAERNNDVQAFLQAVRARDQQVKAATEDRDTSVEDAGINAQRQREELAINLAAEVEDAKIANAQKLEDLQTRLNRELEAQAIKVAQEFEAETIREQRLKEQRDLALQRELEDFARKEEEKQAKLEESLADQFAALAAAKEKELALIAQVEAEKTAIVAAEVERRKALLAARLGQQEAAGGGEGALPFAPGRGEGGMVPFQSGGRPPVGQPVTVGEAGPEIFVPDQAGTIIPNNAIFSPPAQVSPLSAGSSSVTNNSPTFNLAESMFQDPVARRNLTNFVLGVLAERV